MDVCFWGSEADVRTDAIALFVCRSSRPWRTTPLQRLLSFAGGYGAQGPLQEAVIGSPVDAAAVTTAVEGEPAMQVGGARCGCRVLSLAASKRGR